MGWNSIASSIASWLLLDLGLSAISTIISPIGIEASGKPTLKLAFIAASSLGPILGLAKPISS